MTTNITVPQTGMGITEGEISRWLKAVGDPVEAGEVIVEIETAKAIQEVESPVSGVIKEILAEEGATVPVRETIAVIE